MGIRYISSSDKYPRKIPQTFPQKYNPPEISPNLAPGKLPQTILLGHSVLDTFPEFQLSIPKQGLAVC